MVKCIVAFSPSSEGDKLSKRSTMGSYHRQVAILVPDDELECYVLPDFFALNKNSLAFHAGLMLPPRSDGFPLSLLAECNK